MKRCVDGTDWVAKVKKAIDDKTQAGWVKTLTERWRDLLDGEMFGLYSEQEQLKICRKRKLRITPREYAESDRDKLIERFAEKLIKASPTGRTRHTPRRIIINEIKLDIRPTSVCYVEYMGEMSEKEVEGRKSLIGLVTVDYGDGHFTKVRVHNRYISKTFHQYVGLVIASK